MAKPYTVGPPHSPTNPYSFQASEKFGQHYDIWHETSGAATVVNNASGKWLPIPTGMVEQARAIILDGIAQMKTFPSYEAKVSTGIEPTDPPKIVKLGNTYYRAEDAEYVKSALAEIDTKLAALTPAPKTSYTPGPWFEAKYDYIAIGKTVSEAFADLAAATFASGEIVKNMSSALAVPVATILQKEVNKSEAEMAAILTDKAQHNLMGGAMPIPTVSVGSSNYTYSKPSYPHEMSVQVTIETKTGAGLSVLEFYSTKIASAIADMGMGDEINLREHGGPDRASIVSAESVHSLDGQMTGIKLHVKLLPQIKEPVFSGDLSKKTHDALMELVFSMNDIFHLATPLMSPVQRKTIKANIENARKAIGGPQN